MSAPARDYDVAVVGGGPWGVGLARAAARAGRRVLLLSRREQPAIERVDQAKMQPGAAARAPLIVLAVPSARVESVAAELEAHLDGSHLLVHGIRGLVGDDLRTVSEVLREATPVRRLGALGGPALVEELARGAPSVLVVGSRFPEVVAAFRESFAGPSLRVYATNDLVGLEWASALTGCVAVAIGCALGAGMGPGLVAAFTTRAMHEIARLALEAGGERSTLLDLAGLGDLLAALNQPGRPEVALGRLLTEGVPLDEARRRVPERIEALELVPRVHAWAEARKVRTPILRALHDVVFAGRGRDEVLGALMQGPVVDERG
ncbi:MAG TPA: NAD(P)-binding domain-containing protein [Polyangiaceae bacterium]|nr:NAD(P)-binding domain-containing protein [Polyangiaceae bacterium]